VAAFRAFDSAKFVVRQVCRRDAAFAKHACRSNVGSRGVCPRGQRCLEHGGLLWPHVVMVFGLLLSGDHAAHVPG
jgi:hypothetical protein